ncbi:MAG TPA: PIN domain-containing protein [Candidatus Thermoplasmatota archaeon]|nr:PIN domain-containing protein [Candidatus Thermoplasmatota archaeon]
MTGSDVFFDSWAWWEVLAGTKKGRSLWAKYASAGGGRIHSSVLTIAEIASKLARTGHPANIEAMVGVVEGESSLHQVTIAHARAAGALHVDLRRRAPEASLADALILAAARSEGLTLVSGDAAFHGLPDVTSS